MPYFRKVNVVCVRRNSKMKRVKTYLIKTFALRSETGRVLKNKILLKLRQKNVFEVVISLSKSPIRVFPFKFVKFVIIFRFNIFFYQNNQ